MSKHRGQFVFWLESFMQLFLPLFVYFLFHAAVQVIVSSLLGMEFYMNHSTAVQCVGNAVLLPVFFRMYRGKQSHPESEQKAEKRSLSAGDCLKIIGVSVCFSRGVNLLIGLTPLPGWFPAYESASASVMREAFWIQLLAVVVFAPVAEELLMRGLIYGRLKSMTGNIKLAILASSLLFALFHGNIVQGIYAFALGALFAWLMERCKTLWAPVLAHAAANAVTLALSLPQLSEGLSRHPAVTILLTAVFLLAGYFLAKRIEDSGKESS